MTIGQRKGFKAIAVFLAFAMLQIYVQTSLAEPGTNSTIPLPQQFVARLTTRGNQAILVNGASATTGASILTGATIETPADVGATINLGALGTFDLAPNTIVQFEVDQNGNIKIKLKVGCVILRTKKNTEGEIDTDQGPAGKTDKKKGGILDVCFPPGATGPTVGQGAAASAGAGAGAGAAAAGAAAAGGGLGTATIASIIIGGTGLAIGLPVALKGGNPSTITPTP